MLTLSLATASGALGTLALAQSPATAGGAAAPAEVLRIQTSIEVKVAPDEADALQKRCSSELQAYFLSASVLPGTAGEDPELRVTVEATDDPENPGYVARAELFEAGTPVEGSVRETSCELCTHGEVAIKLRAQVELLVGFWRVRKAEPVAPTGPTGVMGSTGPEGPAAPTGEDPSTGRVKPPVRGLGALGYAGIGAMALGGVGVGVGAAFVGRGVEPIGPTFVDAKDNRTPGMAAIGIGAGVLVTGAVLLAVDRIRAKRASREERAQAGRVGDQLAMQAN